MRIGSAGSAQQDKRCTASAPLCRPASTFPYPNPHAHLPFPDAALPAQQVWRAAGRCGGRRGRLRCHRRHRCAGGGGGKEAQRWVTSVVLPWVALNLCLCTWLLMNIGCIHTASSLPCPCAVASLLLSKCALGGPQPCSTWRGAGRLATAGRPPARCSAGLPRQGCAGWQGAAGRLEPRPAPFLQGSLP